ncbi:hypothetical protein [Dongia sp.]|uniref:hypothetical protein n=1 Tax=Dongia sp. TaxID=1977262 RepID=UPI0035B0CA11
MSDSWDMSFLIDQATRIHEARGNFGKHFGRPLRGLVDDHLVNFVAQEDRILFLRFMAKLLLQTGITTATARIHTPIIGEKVFELDARNGSRPKTWWLMLSATNARGYQHLSDIVDTDPMASDEEFGNLAISAARQGGGKLGMTMFQSKAVSERSFGKMTPERREALDKRIGEVLVEATDTGVVTKPEAGHYAVLHGEGVSPQQISDRIVQAASEMEITEQELGLSRATETVAENVDAEEVGRMIRDMRKKLVDRATREPIPERVEWGKHPTFLEKVIKKVKK